MSNFTVFKQKISFLESSDRYYLTTLERNEAMRIADKDFLDFYLKCGNIRAVLQQYMEGAGVITKLRALDILFQKLPDVGIYDVTKEKFNQECWNLDEADDACDAILDLYNEIEEELALEKAYRQDRKDSRGRWEGGGFGLGGAVKGAATAGALNMVSGLGHSLINAIGNAGSSISAANAKDRLYNNDETFSKLSTGIQFSIWDIYDAYMTLVNEYYPDNVYFSNNEFDKEKAKALFQNAKNIPEKREELLVAALRVCPYYTELLAYIFEHYPNERESISKMATCYKVDISACYESVLMDQYNNADHSSEEGLLETKASIQAAMRRFGVKDSEALTAVDQRYMHLVYERYYKNALVGERTQALEKIKNLQAPKDLKKDFVKKHNIWELQNDLHVDFPIAVTPGIALKEYQLLEAQNADKDTIAAAFQKILPALGLVDKPGMPREKERADLFLKICEKKLNAPSAELSKITEKEALLTPIFDYWESEAKTFTERTKLYVVYQKGEANKLRKQQKIVELEPDEYLVILYTSKLTEDERYKTGIAITDKRIVCKGCGEINHTLSNLIYVTAGGFFDDDLVFSGVGYPNGVNLDNNIDKKLFATLLQRTFGLFPKIQSDLQKLEARQADEKKNQLAQFVQENDFLVQCLQLQDWANKVISDRDNMIKAAKQRQIKEIVASVGKNNSASIAKAWCALENSGIDADLIAQEEETLFSYLMALANTADSYAREENLENARQTILACKEDERMQALRTAMDARHEEVVRIENEKQLERNRITVKTIMNAVVSSDPVSIATAWCNLAHSGVNPEFIPAEEEKLYLYLMDLANTADSYACEENLENARQTILACKEDERMQALRTAMDARHEEVVRIEEDRRQTAETKAIMDRCNTSDLLSILAAWDAFVGSNCQASYYESYLAQLDAGILERVKKAKTIATVSQIRNQLAENNTSRYAKHIQYAEEKLQALDTAERTYRGVVFASLEDIELAKVEELKLDIVMRSVSPDDMQSIDNAIAEVSQNPSLIRNVYLDTLNAYKLAQDQKMRLFQGVTYDTVEQAEEAKRIHRVVRDLMSAVNLQDEESILRTKDQIDAMNHPVTNDALRVLQENLDRIDVQKRTVDGILMATLQEADVARQEYANIQNWLAMLNEDDEPAMLETQKNISLCTTAVKDKYLALLQSKLNDYDVRARTFGAVIYKTRELAAAHRQEAARVQQIMQTVSKEHEPSMLLALEELQKLTTNEKDDSVTTLKQWLEAYDIKVRTVAGVLYKTREEAQLVAAEIRRADEIMQKVSAEDEQSILNAQKEILELTTFVRNSKYEILKKMWEDYDLKARTYLEFVFQTRNQAQHAKQSHEEFLRQFNTLDLAQRSSLVTLTHFVEDHLPAELTQQTLAMIEDVRKVLDEVDYILQKDATITDMVAQKKESAELHKNIEKVLPNMTRYRMNTEHMQQLKTKHYASLNAAKKLFSFIKSKL